MAFFSMWNAFDRSFHLYRIFLLTSSGPIATLKAAPRLINILPTEKV